jgi:integrase
MASIQKRTRNGRMTYSVNYRDPAGRSRRKVFARRVDAQRWMADNETARNAGAWVDPAAGRDRFGEWAERWFRTTLDLKPGTRRTYRQLLDNQVLPHFGGATLAGVDRLAVREWVAGLVESGLSPSRIRNAHQVLAQVFAAAVEGGRLARNPAAGVRLPRRVEREMLFLDAAQVEQLADAIAPHYRVLVYFLAYTGLRFGEVVALKWKRLNCANGTCEVVESATEVGSQLEWGTTKTDERRTVRLPRFLCELLSAGLGRELAAGRRLIGLEDLVFTAPQGGPLRERKFLHGQLKPAAVRAGLPATLRAHDLRHTAASLLIRQGASVKAVQAQLGHKSAVVTLDRYGHLWPDELGDLAERLDRARAAAVAAEASPQRRPTVVPIRKGAGQ